MKKTGILTIAVLLSLLLVGLFTPPTPAMAHHMYLTYKTKEIEVLVEFEGGSVAQEARVIVYSPDGAVYVEGVTDENGKFSFEPGEMEGRWKIVSEHTGHKKTVLLEGSEIVESGGGPELPVYTRIAAGFGYLVGIAGIALLIMSRKKSRSSGDRIPQD
jgi:nickel transport protein